MPAVSVVIPTRDRLGLLREAVTSAVSQAGVDLEVVVVDDASGDGTAEWVGRHPDPRVRLVRLRAHSERSVARNTGLGVARGELVLFLDDDDVLCTGALARLCRSLQRHPTAAAAVGAAAVVDGSGQRRRTPGFPRVPFVKRPLREVLAGWVAVPSQTLFRAGPLRDLRGFREDLSFAEDQELWMRLATHHQVAFVPAVVVHKRVHDTSSHLGRALELERELRRGYLDRCPAALLPAATRATQAHPLLRQATLAFEADDYRLALVSLSRALSLDPWLLASPVVGPGLALGAAKAALGSALPAALAQRSRRALRGARRVLGREPGHA